MPLPDLLEPLDRFLEVADRAQEARVVAALEARLEGKIGAAFRAQGRLFMAGWRTRPGHPAPAPLREAIRVADMGPLGADIVGWAMRLFEGIVAKTRRLFQKPMVDGAAAALAHGATATIAHLDAPTVYTATHPRVVAYLASVGGERVTGITDTTREQLRALLSQGVGENWSQDRTTKAIGGAFKDMATSRARLIAATEIGQAVEAGAFSVAADQRDAGQAMEKSWRTVGDDRVDASCRANEAAGWIPLADNFPSGHPHPLDHPGCRCTAQYQRRVGP